jgi:aminobenzoyl-glutamate utilization protein B
MTDDQEKKFALESIERNSEPIALLCDNIFYFAELGHAEFETFGLMMQILERAGFTIERNPSGMPPGFIDIYGSVKPVIALHTEFDATPGCSQAPGVAEPTPIVDGPPGHTEGTTSMAGDDRRGVGD